MRRWSLWSSVQYSCWMEHRCCNARARQNPLSALPRSAWYHNAAAARKPCGATERCSPPRSLGQPNPSFACLGVYCLNLLTSLLYCSPPPGLGVRRLTPPTALPPSWDCPFPLLFIFPLYHGAKFGARSGSCVHPKAQRRRPGCRVALLRKRVTWF